MQKMMTRQPLTKAFPNQRSAKAPAPKSRAANPTARSKRQSDSDYAMAHGRKGC